MSKKDLISRLSGCNDIRVQRFLKNLPNVSDSFVEKCFKKKCVTELPYMDSYVYQKYSEGVSVVEDIYIEKTSLVTSLEDFYKKADTSNIVMADISLVHELAKLDVGIIVTPEMHLKVVI